MVAWSQLAKARRKCFPKDRGFIPSGINGIPDFERGFTAASAVTHRSEKRNFRATEGQRFSIADNQRLSLEESNMRIVMVLCPASF